MTTLIQARPKFWAAAIIIGFCALSASAFAARPPDAGNGGGGGGGGGGSAPPDLGDLIMLYRDANGVPILTADSCQQPLAAPGINLPAIEPYPACTAADTPTNTCVIPVDPTTCAVVVGYETYTQEVDFGRTSVVRSPVSVLEQQLDDVVVNLSTADCTSLDPAGRLVTSTVADDLTVTSGAIDSPLQNLAIYRQLMLTGYLGSAEFPLDLKDDNPLNTAARGLGAASDKTGKVGVDTVAYLNQIMGLTDESVPTLLPKLCIEVKEEVKGVVKNVRKCFLDYGPTGGDYGYGREANFGSLPNPPYIPAGETPEAGWFEYLIKLSETPTFGIYQGPILDTVFCSVPVDPFTGTCSGDIDPGFTGGNIGGFALAADDTRAVIDFMHSNPLPLAYVTPVPCGATPGGDTTYDVSISPQSGLQVPVQMVDGSEGREFTVSIANAGPDAATGYVEVTALAANGAIINEGNPWIFSFPAADTVCPDPIAAGGSCSWTQPFSIDLGARTTINWTATIHAVGDVNSTNNSVTATTNVRVTSGGGGG